MVKDFRKLWETNAIWVVLISAAFFRLLAAIFSAGYAFSDDHFVVIEVAQRWVEGQNEWFDQGKPIRRSILYPGLHYILFYGLEQLNITDPQTKMLITRFFHAVYSMLIVIFGYLVTLHSSGPRAARQAGMILALFWILPFMSVRNLVEMVCIPPLLIGFFFTLKSEYKHQYRYWFFAGAMFALAFTIRFQTMFIIAPVGLILLLQKRWEEILNYVGGFLAVSVLTIGLVDWIAWGKPFGTVYQYVAFNLEHSRAYVVGPWYRYTLLILGIFIPPVSFLFVFGFLKTWRKLALLFWPTLVFIVFHSYFPNKQERFMLPVIPFIIILGVIGWDDYVKNSAFWQRRKKLLTGLWSWFWAINGVLLIVLSLTYTKKNRVETLYHIYKQNGVTGVIWESSRSEIPIAPTFYLDKKVPLYRIPTTTPWDALESYIMKSDQPFPNYIVFLGEKGIEERVNRFENHFARDLILEKKVTPSLVDDIAFRLNPEHNVNQTSFVYRVRSNEQIGGAG